MNLFPTIRRENLFTDAEIEFAAKIIEEHFKITVDTGQYYNDSGGIGKDYNKLIAKWYDEDYNKFVDLKQLLVPKLNELFGYSLVIQDIHMLESFRPYGLHTDAISTRDSTPKEVDNSVPEYTIIIPVESCDSYTIIFNETHETTNNFEPFKKEYTGELNVKLDKTLIAERLTHLHPNDIRYLTLHSIQEWNKGCMFAVDRRYYHCSDNFTKRNVTYKKSIIVRTVREIS